MQVTVDEQLWSPSQWMAQFPPPVHETGPLHDESVVQSSSQEEPAGHTTEHGPPPVGQVVTVAPEREQAPTVKTHPGGGPMGVGGSR